MNNSIRYDSDAAILRRNLDKTNNVLSQTLTRMSSGIKVLSAKDDASNIVLSSKLNIEIKGLNTASNNIQQGCSMFNIADGALSNAQSILSRLRDIALQSLNGTSDKEQINALQKEADELTAELERIQSNTKYNNINLFNNQKKKSINQNGQEISSDMQQNNNISNNVAQNTISPLYIRPKIITTSFSDPPSVDEDVGKIPIASSDILLDNDVGKTSESNPQLNISPILKSSAGGLRLLGAEASEIGTSIENPICVDTEEGIFVSGALDFEKNQRKFVSIDGVVFDIQNRNNAKAAISYQKNTESGEITFISNYFTIKAVDMNQDYKFIVNGIYNYIWGGDKTNAFTPYDLTRSKNNQFHGGSADEVFEIIGYNNSYYGEGGNDTFNIRENANSYNYCYGGEGNDTFNHNINSTEYYYGDNGDDIFNVYGNSARCYGRAGEDTFTITSGNNVYLYGEADNDNFTVQEGAGNTQYIDGGAGDENRLTLIKTPTDLTAINVGNNSTAYSTSLGQYQTEEIVINVNGQNITYKVTNNQNNVKDLIIKKQADGRIDFLTNNITITAQKDVTHYVGLMSGTITYIGGDLEDKVYMGSSSQIVDTGNGDDIVYCQSSYNSVCTAKGKDTVYLNGGSANIDTGEDDDILTIVNGSYSHIDLGSGNDTVNGKNSYTATSENNNKNYQTNTIFAGEGVDTFKLSGLSANASVNYILDGFNETKFQTLELGASETKTITINTNKGDIEYSIKNDVALAKTIHYYYDAVEDKVIFAGHRVTIKGQEDERHIVDLYGNYIYFYGGNDNDEINAIATNASFMYGMYGNDILNSTTTTSNTRFYGDNSAVKDDDGNDAIYVNGTSGYVYGGGGNDTIKIKGASCQICDGQQGDDIYYINNNVSSIDNFGNNVYHIETNKITLSAGAGDDTFYIKGDDNIVAGGGGDDYFVISGTGNTIDGGTGENYIVDNTEGNVNNKTNTKVDPNSGGTSFSRVGEMYSFTIDNKTYTIINSTETAENQDINNVSYTYNKNTGEIIFTGSNLTITGWDNTPHVIRIEGDNNTIQGGALSDTIIVNKGTNNIVKGNSGNDAITINTENNFVEGGNGDDTVTINVTTSKKIDLGDGNDTLFINSDNNTNIQTGPGNDTIRSTTGTSGNIIDLSNGNNDLLLNGNNNEITSLNGNNRISVVGNENNIESGSGKNIIGATGDNNTLSARGNSTFNAQGIGNKFNLSGNNNTVNSKGNDNEVVSIGNSTMTLNGENSYVSSIGKSTINVKGNNSSVVSNGNSNIMVEGLNCNINSIGNSIINQIGNSATIETETGSVKLNGNSTTLSAKGVNLDINGNNNEVENISNEEMVINANIVGNNNNIILQNTSDKVSIEGNGNTVLLNNGDDSIELKGDNNSISASKGINTFKARGSYNNIQGGTNSDTFRINSGEDNVIDGGNDNEKNIIVDYGENSTITNCLDITPIPLDVCFQVGTNSEEEITQTIQFALGDFFVDFTNSETTKESLTRIDNLIDEVCTQKASIGATLNRLENILELSVKRKINLQNQKSVIADADIAEESMKKVQNEIRQDMIASLFAQNNNLKRQSILNLVYNI